MARKKKAVTLSERSCYIQEKPLFFDYDKIKETYKLEDQYKLGMIGENDYKKALEKAQKMSNVTNNQNQATVDTKERRPEMRTEETKETKKTSKKEYTEKEYIDLILNMMQMVFARKIKGFEVKNASSGKLKIIIK